PQDAHLFWNQDRMHFPEALTPLDEVFVCEQFEAGFNQAATAYSLPVRTRTQAFNYWYYLSIYPIVRSPEEAAELGKRAQELVGATMARLADRWATEWLPEVEQHLAYWQEFDLRGASAAALAAHFDETLARTADLWRIHFDVAVPFLMAISTFDELYRDLFGNESAFDSYRLSQGLDNTMLAMGRALWRLSRTAAASPEVRRALETEAAGSVLAKLEGVAGAQTFRAELQTFLDEYGRRGDSWGLIYPTWLENPTPVIQNLKDYVTQPDRDLDADLAAQVAQREQLVATARERLQGYPAQVREQFDFLLKAAQEATVLTEDHGFWIDFRSFYEIRRAILEIGRRLADAAVIDARDDVFFLVPDEIRESLSQLAANGGGQDRRATVNRRRTELEHFRTITPPPAIGEDHGPPPPNDPVALAIGKFFGGPPPASADPSELRGAAGSPGKVRGTARIIRSLSEAARLQPGDILVTATTAPPWTPLFATARAVVTDTGGILSHCAVVAREYRIPAVVGVGRATAAIQDGQTVEVDGSAGVVRIVG
ncbi:MAG: hypothetical protein HY329_10355, partial [Chloroflexi bacterium]|nr:hypothetical protein [Chloroflexota bacterium]